MIVEHFPVSVLTSHMHKHQRGRFCNYRMDLGNGSVFVENDENEVTLLLFFGFTNIHLACWM